MRARTLVFRGVLRWIAVGCALGLCGVGGAFALVPRQQPARFDDLVRRPEGAVPGVIARPVGDLPGADPLRDAWEGFIAEQQGQWRAFLDERAGLPTLASGRGIEWLSVGEIAADGSAALARLDRLAREFLDQHAPILGRWDGQLELDRAASGPAGEHVYQVVYRQVVAGVPVEGARFDFQLVDGALVAFGATRWSEVETPVQPQLGRDAARSLLDRYLSLGSPDEIVEAEPASLRLLALGAEGSSGEAWNGRRGRGYTHRLVWRFVFTVPGEPATWIGDVDARSGEIVSLYDETRYNRAKGGVFPLSSDGVGPEGTEQAGYPMPFLDVAEGSVTRTTDDLGLLTCSGASSLTTELAGPYIKVSDKCGAVSESFSCPADVDLRFGPGTDCEVPAGSSPGNTHASRSSFYHLNRAMEKGRAWLPDNEWLQSQVVDNVNINNTCNAFWNGSVNFYRSGGGCRNTGELQGVFVHEWGHGLDQNDGGGYDNPSEAYADIVAIFESRESCVGRGFKMSGNCGGYGDACLDCTGIRDQDFDKHQRHTPATPANFLATNCGGGGGPCGREVHCESYVSAEAVFDLAARDLPAMGVDQASAWQLAEKLFYLSRKGSGGDAYNCALPDADGCGTNSWFHKFRLQDDNDGNLNNGTPHAGAIFAAFDRHGIACGLADDPENRSAGTCVSMAKPVLQARTEGQSILLSWDAVSSADRYLILRNDTGCQRGQVIVDTVAAPATSYTDTPVPNGLTMYYRVQAQQTNRACESPVSDCVAAGVPSFAGTVSFDRSAYGCGSTIEIEVRDGNAPQPSVTASVWSSTEPQPETVTLTETESGSGRYLGTITTTTSPPDGGDGLLSVADGDTLTVEYIDADDGLGGSDVARNDTAATDCVTPGISDVHTEDVTDTAGTVVWDTTESTDGSVTWGEAIPPSSTTIGASGTASHRVPLTGLDACTIYYYDVRSADPAGNLAIDDNRGAYYQLQTLGDFGNGPEPCRQATVSIDTAAPSCGGSLAFSVVDADLNTDPDLIETSVVEVTSSTETQPEVVIVTETSANSLRFSGSIMLTGTDPLADGKLSVRDGDLLTVSHFDPSDGHGGSLWATASSHSDCQGPGIHDLAVTSLTNARGWVSFTTDEPAGFTLEWGRGPELGETVDSAALATDHQVVLNDFQSCEPFYLRVTARDAAGNEQVADDGGAPFSARTYEIPGLYWMENFENGTNGWSLEDEWEIGAPQGLGGLETGFPDPARAYNNGAILGHDLSGLGATPGDYEANTRWTKASSPTQNASAWHNTKLLVYRQLNAAAGGEAALYVCTGSCQSVYRSGSLPVSEEGYRLESYDLSSKVDGKSSMRLEFRQNGLVATASGWNVDDVILKDGSLPDYAACGGCGQAPSFAGASSATDGAPCGAAGVTVSWEPAVGWGSGEEGTYAVYRGSEPGFPADAAHLVASGLTGLSYDDGEAPDGALYYLVRAENDESCGTGPANGGLTDENAVYAPVDSTSSAQTPGEVTGVEVTLVGHAHVRLDWVAASAADTYRVYRSPSPQPADFTLLAETGSLYYEDSNEASDEQARFYLVRAANACGEEGP